MKTTLWVGSGAVKNSWNPVLRALNKFRIIDTKEDANFFLAHCVYLCRFMEARKTKTGGKEPYDWCLGRLNAIRNEICQELKSSQEKNEITVWPEFRSIADRIIFPDCNQLKIISTNWDEVIDIEFSKILKQKEIMADDFVVHFHGHISSTRTIYLPTEIVEEKYRDVDELNHLGSLMSSSLSYGMETNHFIIYGLSFSALDAELAQIFGSSLAEGKVKLIDIIDSKPELVSSKIRILNDTNRTFEIREHKPSEFK